MNTTKDKRLMGSLISVTIAACFAIACSDSTATDSGQDNSAASTQTPGVGTTASSGGSSAAAVAATGGASAVAASSGAGGNTQSSGGALGAKSTAGAKAGAGGSVGKNTATAGAGGSAGKQIPATGAGGATGGDLGEGDGKDVICIGDSWMAGIGPQLLTMRPYRNYSMGGIPVLEETATMGRTTVPKQYQAAKSEDPDIKTVVMTAGGIDLAEGPGQGPEGNAAVAKAVGEMFEQMGKDGVRDAVYFSYSRATAEALMTPLIETCMKLCNETKALRCHYIDSDTIINRQLADGIHPTPEGAKALADAALKLMKEKGMRR